MPTSTDAAFDRRYERLRKSIDAKVTAAYRRRKPVSLYEPAVYAMKGGGKRVRPVVTLLAAEAVGGRAEDATDAAIALEALHNFTLVHDDIMDNSAMRRGVPTVHKKYDVATAVLVGDAMLAVSYEFMLRVEGERGARAARAFNRGLVEVCEGQGLDKEFETRDDVTLREYIKMIGKKTAALLEACCRVGAIIGGGTDGEVEALADYGVNLGLAFQIQDDYLDLFGDEKFGKPIGGDLREGKKTYLLLSALKRAAGSDKKRLERIAHKGGAVKKEIPAIRKLYESLGVPEDAGRAVRRYTNKALASLDALSREDGRENFAQLANRLLERNA
jgi:geranylgeranyl diphosphate synthase, type II